jgi:hypothetical protein
LANRADRFVQHFLDWYEPSDRPARVAKTLEVNLDRSIQHQFRADVRYDPIATKSQTCRDRRDGPTTDIPRGSLWGIKGNPADHNYWYCA